MKISVFVTTLALGLTLAAESHANDINSSWSIQSLQSQAMSQTIKRAKMQRYTARIRHRTRQKTGPEFGPDHDDRPIGVNTGKDSPNP